MGERSSGTLPSVRPPDDRLDSWKEIAVYLHRDVTTVQRWEGQEGMPVHRHLHGKMGSVYASRADLDAWVRGRNIPSSKNNQNGTAAAETLCPHVAFATPVTARRSLLPLAAAAVALAIGAS